MSFGDQGAASKSLALSFDPTVSFGAVVALQRGPAIAPSIDIIPWKPTK